MQGKNHKLAVTIVSRQSIQVLNLKRSQMLMPRDRIIINYRKEHRKKPGRAKSQMKTPRNEMGSQPWSRDRITFWGYTSVKTLAASNSIC